MKRVDWAYDKLLLLMTLGVIASLLFCITLFYVQDGLLIRLLAYAIALSFVSTISVLVGIAVMSYLEYKGVNF